MRCLAVVQRWIEAGGAARLACTVVPHSLSDRYAAAGARVDRRADWPATDVSNGSDVVIVDTPYVETRTLSEIAAHATFLVTLDDTGNRSHYPGDLLLNQNSHATAELYAGKTTAQVCLGTAWCLLRSEFRPWVRKEKLIPQRIGNLLVMMGGADPHGHSAMLMTAAVDAAGALTSTPEVTLVAGAANANLDTLRRQAAAALTPASVRHDVRDMPALLANADLVVSAAGSTTWELAALGTPMILGAQNDTETGPAEATARHGAAIYLGGLEGLDKATLAAAIVALANDTDRRQRISDAGRSLVDGLGVDRLVALIAAGRSAGQTRNS